jgi:superfamily II DNA helicase RecQ
MADEHVKNTTQREKCPRHIVFNPYSAFYMELCEIMDMVQMFHSCTSEDMKEEIRMDMGQEGGRIRVLIATNAVGMGVNYKGVNHIIHYGIPKDMDSFIQQLGRAGRDGGQSDDLIYNSRHLKNVDEDMCNYVNNCDSCDVRNCSKHMIQFQILVS